VGWRARELRAIWRWLVPPNRFGPWSRVELDSDRLETSLGPLRTEVRPRQTKQDEESCAGAEAGRLQVAAASGVNRHTKEAG
jgi:hypothetical protein